MNVISYNVRGLGSGVKWAAIRRMVWKEKIDLLCIQETKTEKIDMSVCQALWEVSFFLWDGGFCLVAGGRDAGGFP